MTTLVEDQFDTWFSIKNATAQGVVVVEAAGNGFQPEAAPGAPLPPAVGIDLNSFACNKGVSGGRYIPGVSKNSGAIMVGAGASGTRDRLGFSNFGSRVDVQGWGNGVATLGYGTSIPLMNLFDPGDAKQRYTNNSRERRAHQQW